MTYDDLDKEVLRVVQSDISLESRPYKVLAEKLKISEEEIVSRLQRMKKIGIIRRLGAVLKHHAAGFVSNAMVVWRAPEEQADTVGAQIAGFKAVSHCYLRQVPPDFGYNLFTMVHARSQPELQQVIRGIAASAGINDYIIIESIRELKKTSMVFF